VLPLCAAGDIGDLDALRLEFVADTVGLGEVFGLFRVIACLDLRGHSGIVTAILAEDGIRTCGRLFSRIALADLICLFAQVKAQYLVEIIKDEQLRRVVGLVFEHVVQCCNRKRGIQIIAERGVEFLAQCGHGSLVDLAVAGLQRSDFRQQLLIRSGSIVKVFPCEDQIAAVVALQAEQAVAQRVVALLLQ